MICNIAIIESNTRVNVNASIGSVSRRQSASVERYDFIRII